MSPSAFVPTPLTGVVLVLGSIGLSLLGLMLVRRSLPQRVLEDDHGVVSTKLQVLGTIYAVLLAFMVVVNWQDFEAVTRAVDREAVDLIDVYRDARGFPSPMREELRQRLEQYAERVIADEWRALERDDSSQSARTAFAAIWATFFGFDPQTEAHSVLYSETLRRLNRLSEARHERLHANESMVPGVLWLVLILGAVVTVCFSYFLRARSFILQAVTTAAFAGLITLIIFVILVLDHPFGGAAALNPHPFQVAQSTFNVIRSAEASIGH